jgi:hypothetical protein
MTYLGLQVLSIIGTIDYEHVESHVLDYHRVWYYQKTKRGCPCACTLSSFSFVVKMFFVLLILCEHEFLLNTRMRFI